MKAANQILKCPICNEGTKEKYRPFCSKRCSEIDLGRWFNESYVIPGEQTSLGQENDDEMDY
ncbi:DNA gyrase inhibitor YacG [Pseudemcibacter aquimaris]|uniref:DNA gyrase inhibitor YacG n=1 Tax=Pseudemcibacter aquimaris TaxID=2857064 RepID=UPI00201264A3|nr:DNA gyrase inhibitor YacG [Pseudemcibacter aquimaris]MCC3861160.1 DNA gyrase inhibitor YacG [Pseudemcibacter aquimaris]WDU57935.1 DNA gyrase inhibitor YacG [Pseudemcibacter aquimaris]